MSNRWHDFYNKQFLLILVAHFTTLPYDRSGFVDLVEIGFSKGEVLKSSRIQQESLAEGRLAWMRFSYTDEC